MFVFKLLIIYREKHTRGDCVWPLPTSLCTDYLKREIAFSHQKNELK